MGCGWLRTLFKVGLGLLSAFIEGWFVIFLNGWPGLRVYLRLAQNFIYGGWLAGSLAYLLASSIACLLPSWLGLLWLTCVVCLLAGWLAGLLSGYKLGWEKNTGERETNPPQKSYTIIIPHETTFISIKSS